MAARPTTSRPTTSRPKTAAPRTVGSATAGSPTAPLRIVVAGASGFIGTELTRQLDADGHDVIALVRRQPKNEHEINWAPSAHMLDANVLDSVDAVINLSGASLGKLPWTAKYRREILNSRLQATETLAETMLKAANPPSVFLSGSAVGIYGDRPGERLTEDSKRGEGFLADVVEAWEQAATIRPAKTRLVTFRTGFVLGNGGSLAPVMALTKLGLGTRFGTGGDIWPWISLYDEAAAIRHLLTSTLTGAVNLVGPTPATSDSITHYIAERMHRPYALRAPAWAIELGLRDAADELLLSSQPITPTKLLADGFEFRDSTAEAAIDAILPKL